MNEVIQYWQHRKCGTKIQFTDAGAYCPLCRHGVTGGNLVTFENPVITIIPNRENLNVPEQRLHGHSRYTGAVDGVER